MKTKEIKISDITSIKKYLRLFSGIFRLTEAELDILAEMIIYQLKALQSGTATDPFNAHAKKIICSNLGISNPYSINTYIQRLRKKGAIVQTPRGQMLHPWIMPKGEQQIVISLQWKLNGEK